jgi:hypothetical protein
MAERAASSLVCPYTSPVMATLECPSRSATALMCTPDSSHATAAECRSVWAPTPSTPAAFAAVSMTHKKLGAEHQPVLAPLAARGQSLLLLRGAVAAQHRHDRRVQRDDAPRAVGFRPADEKPPADACNGGDDFQRACVQIHRRHGRANASPLRSPVDAVSSSAG